MRTSSERAAFDRQYRDELARLVARIETLPVEHRERLLAALEAAQHQHEKMQATCRQIEDMVADVGLFVEHARLDVEASARELRAVDPAGRPTLRRPSSSPRGIVNQRLGRETQGL
jgi:hypothetical protein